MGWKQKYTGLQETGLLFPGTVCLGEHAPKRRAADPQLFRCQRLISVVGVQGLLGDVMVNGLGDLISVLSEAVPEAGALLGMFMGGGQMAS